MKLLIVTLFLFIVVLSTPNENGNVPYGKSVNKLFRGVTK